jgi:hypothetical protein
MTAISARENHVFLRLVAVSLATSEMRVELADGAAASPAARDRGGKAHPTGEQTWALTRSLGA